MDNADKGELFVKSQNITKLNNNQIARFRNLNIGFVFQFFNLIPVLTAEENILLPYLLDNAKPDREYIGHIISVLGIEDELKHLPSQLSGGEQQRVAVARALMNKPAVVFADEPTGNLDSSHGDEVMKILTDLNENGTTIIMVTHSEHDAKYSHRIIRMLDGQKVTENILV